MDFASSLLGLSLASPHTPILQVSTSGRSRWSPAWTSVGRTSWKGLATEDGIVCPETGGGLGKLGLPSPSFFFFVLLVRFFNLTSAAVCPPILTPLPPPPPSSSFWYCVCEGSPRWFPSPAPQRPGLDPGSPQASRDAAPVKTLRVSFFSDLCTVDYLFCYFGIKFILWLRIHDPPSLPPVRGRDCMRPGEWREASSGQENRE